MTLLFLIMIVIFLAKKKHDFNHFMIL